MILLALSLALGFLTVFMGTPYTRRYLIHSGIIAVDQQKEGKPRLATSGGIPVLFGFLISVTSYLALSVFFDSSELNRLEALAALNSVFIIALIGLLDDIHIDIKSVIEDGLDLEPGELEIDSYPEVDSLPHQELVEKVSIGKKESDDLIRKGIGQVPKMLFVLPAALPLIAVGAGSWVMVLPVVGTVNWGVVYPLVLLPIGLLFVSNVANMLAGTNGLAASLSLVTSTSLGIVGILAGSMEAALIAFSLSTGLLAFLYYNFYPASVLPGDSLTYLAGAAMFSAMVIGDMEKFGLFVFTPWIIEFFLKARSGFQAHSWGVLQDDGTLKPQHKKNYSLTHPLMRRGFNEKQVTLVLTGIQTLICLTGLVLYTQGIL